MNNNLIIFYTDDSKDVFSFSLDTDEQSALEKFKEIRPKVDKTKIKKYFYMKDDEVSPDTYGNFCELSENGKMKMNLRGLFITKRVEEIRKKRDALLANLDLPFMRAMEDEEDNVKNHIKTLKQFLRSLPENLRFQELTDEEIITYNPFGNVFEIFLLQSGSNYKKPPTVTIDPPRKPTTGFPAKALAFIKDEKISKIEIIDSGCRYDFIPMVTIEDSDSGEKSYAQMGR